MKEIPMPFSAAMIRAVLAGTKTETRRTRGLDRINEAPDEWQLLPDGVGPMHSDPEINRWRFHAKANGVDKLVDNIESIPSPYGVAGDKLWFREAWRTWIGYDAVPPSEIPHTASIWYEADGTAPERFGKLRPAMFMCRWMSRKSATVVVAYPERLHDITEAGAIAEGCQQSVDLDQEFINQMEPGSARDLAVALGPGKLTAKLEYFLLWDSINGPGSAAKNPWCWCTKFSVSGL